MSYTRPVDVRMFGDRRFRALSRPQPNAQSLWQFLLYGPHTTGLPGLSELSAEQAGGVLGWSPADVRRCMAEIVAQEMAWADWEARVVFVSRVIDYVKPGPKNIAGFVSPFDMVPECDLKVRWLENAESWCREKGGAHAAAFEESFGKSLAKRSPILSPMPSHIGSGTASPMPSPSLSLSISSSISTSPSEGGRAEKKPPPPEATALAQRLASRILANNPKAKPPGNLAAWAEEFERCHRIDGWSWSEMEELVDWCQRDGFWRSNILSAATFRKQRDRLLMQMRRPVGPQDTEREAVKAKEKERRRLEAECLAVYRSSGEDAVRAWIRRQPHATRTVLDLLVDAEAAGLETGGERDTIDSTEEA